MADKIDTKSGSSRLSRASTAQAALCDKMSFAASESYKLLRANLMFTLPESGHIRIIGVTSAVRGEGKSTTSINLAYELAQTGANVLLIDGDMRLPNISKKLDITSKNGLSSVLAGLCDVQEAVCVSQFLKNLYIMPSGIVPPNPSELLASNNMKNLVKSLVNIEYVVLDLPPVNIVSDALVVSNLLDGMIVIVRQNYSDKKSLETCVQRLKLVNAKIAGFVFNDATEEGTHYGKYKKYSKEYKKYYKQYGKAYASGYGYGEGYEKKTGNV